MSYRANRIAIETGIDVQANHLPAEVMLNAAKAAAERLASDIVRTPQVIFPSNDRVISMKMEALQTLGSFKIRCSTNAIKAHADEISDRIATASAGNFAQGLALAASRQSIELTVHVPETAAKTKIEALNELGAIVQFHSFDRWWEIIQSRETGIDDGIFIHPVAEYGVLEGNATIGLEILNDLPDVDVILVPFGGGGLVCGVAMAAKAIKPEVKVIAVEADHATPLTSAFEADEPVTVEKKVSFIDGIGSTRVMDDMWPLLREYVDGTIVVSEVAVKDALLKMMARTSIVAEGAGAAALAASFDPQFAGKTVVPVISGGNIDLGVIAKLIAEKG